MFRPIRKCHPVIKIVNGALIDLPAPMNLSSWWNFGSLLGLCLVVQIVTGLFLAMHYSPSVLLAFSSVVHISQDVQYGWLIRNVHANGASMFFICLYLHVGRGLYYGSYVKREVWFLGILLLILSMATAFVGYVLPWGQMSFWGATVITNLLSAIPYIGGSIVTWLWGGFAVDNATLNRFFMFHFLLPFLLVVLSMGHLLFLHQSGSNNPLGLKSLSSMVGFHPYYTSKDLVGVIVFFLVLCLFSLNFPALFLDPDNFINANPLVTPSHIKPEWYFLWAYTILRSIPNKLGGVIAMFSAILLPAVLPLLVVSPVKSISMVFPGQFVFWGMVFSLGVLTWIGGCPVEAPYEFIGQMGTVAYFSFYVTFPAVLWGWSEVILGWGVYYLGDF